MNASQNLYVIDASNTVTPVMGSWVAFYTRHPVSGQSQFNSYDFLVLLDEDGLSSDWLVSLGPANSQMLIFEASAWLITRALGLPVPDAAFMILEGRQLQTALPQIDWSGIDVWPCFARREGANSPARVSFTDAMLLLATADNRAQALLMAAPSIWEWGSNLHESAELNAFIRRLAVVAGVDPDLATRTASTNTPRRIAGDALSDMAA